MNVAYALEFYVHSGRESNHNFAVLNLLDDKPFGCYEEFNRESEVSAVICRFDSPLLSRFQRSETLFFSIMPESLEDDGEGFYLKITPKSNKKMKLFNTEFNLISQKNIPLERNVKSKRWQILGFEENIPFVDDKESHGINFPLRFEGLPSIGVLDAQMRPMSTQVGRDKDYFLNIQSLVDRHSYREALNSIDEVLGLYPETIFKRDILFLKMAALDGIASEENYEDIIALGKAWIGAYPTDIHVPQVLFILAKTYAAMQFFDEGKYYYERLFNEYKGDKYELLARLDYGEQLYGRGDRKVVLEMYESVLRETNDIEVASLASILLGDYWRKADNKSEAERYLNNVLDANPQFFLEHIQEYYPLMQAWAESGIYEAPAEVVEIMFQSLEDRVIPLYMPMLRDIARWFDRAGNLQKAHKYYQLLLRETESESERKEVRSLDDALLLNDTESNATKRLEHYERVLENYKGKEEEKIALEKKAQTLYEEGAYEKVFAMREELDRLLGKDNEILLKATQELTKNALKAGDCKIVAYYGNLYDIKIPLEDGEYLRVFDCLYENRQYAPALKIAQTRADATTNAEEKANWLYRLAWAEYNSQNYPRAALAARDVLKLSKNPEHNDSAWVLFMAYYQQNNFEEAFKLLPTLESKLENDDKMIEVYRAVLQNALTRKDDMAIKVYANKLMELQTLHKRHEYSPWVELSMVEALNREEKFKESLEMLQKAESYANEDVQKIQVYYLQGYLYDKLKNRDSALESYGRCEKIEAQSPWKNLCIDAKKLLENTK